MTEYIKSKPPAGTLFVSRWAELGPEPGSAVFTIRGKDGRKTEVTVKGRRRQVLEALMLRPVCSASRCRISEAKRALTHEHGIEIITQGYQPDDKGERFGVYFLAANVTKEGDK